MKRKYKPGGLFTLQLTSLMDMFTIILVFLLISMSSEDYDFVRDESVQIPRSKAQGRFEPAVNVVVSKMFVKVEENVVARLLDGEIADELVKAGRIESVVRAARRARERRQTREDEEDVVLIQADRALPYRTVYLIMRSCSIAGYNRYRLVIEKE